MARADKKLFNARPQQKNLPSVRYEKYGLWHLTGRVFKSMNRGAQRAVGFGV
jgi:hypothetical protein